MPTAPVDAVVSVATFEKKARNRALSMPAASVAVVSVAT